MRLLILLLALPLAAAEPKWRTAEPGWRYDFPRDHFEHLDFRTEWWYYTGNVRARDGRRYGFELVFFRQGQRRGTSENASAWRADDVYLAHLAITGVEGGTFRSARRLNRAGPGIAGASFAERRIWNGNWEAKWDAAGAQTLTALSGDIRLNLRLTPAKPPIVHGEDGISRKAAGAGKASHYVSFTRLAVEGTLDGREVSGTAWMDHEWFTHQLEPDQVGWDWFSVQLDSGTELMLFQLRRKDGGADPWSSGTYVDAAGKAHHLRRGDFSLEPVGWWTSPKTSGRYPVRWKIRVPSRKLSLECAALLADQELAEKDAVGPVYWEGAVAYSGSASGVGYLEMTGYAAPVRLE